MFGFVPDEKIWKGVLFGNLCGCIGDEFFSIRALKYKVWIEKLCFWRRNFEFILFRS